MSALSKRFNVGLVDYKVGNLGSLRGAILRQGFRVTVGDRPQDLQGCDALVLPGVGAAPFAMQTLHTSGLADFVTETFLAAKTPIIGICLGMQLMFEQSEEGETTGLGLLPGQVRRLPKGGCNVGWAVTDTLVGAQTAKREAAFYFNHSYFVPGDAPNVIADLVLQDGTQMAAMVQSKRFTGVQFHPEKSQAAGGDLLRYLITQATVEEHA